MFFKSQLLRLQNYNYNIITIKITKSYEKIIIMKSCEYASRPLE